jgi:defect-in-organelle-trafficking protein DotD
MRLNMRGIVLATAATALLGACAQQQPQDHPPALSEGSIQQQVDQQLAQSGNRAANALETLAMIKRVRTEPPAPALDETGLPDDLRRVTTVEWSGPADELVKELASNIGYGFVETGSVPAHPANVQVNIKDTSAAKAFQDIGLQVQSWATVIVDPNLKRVEYRNETAEKGIPASAPSLRKHSDFTK